jgi:hypothetical protein
MTKSVVCTKCEWTYFAVTKAYAEAQVKEFNDYYNRLTEEEQISYYGGKPSSIDNYESCHCGNKEFREGSTAPEGSTIDPIIWEGK